MSQKIYAGIGSRRTPETILKKMAGIASILNQNNWILRSGGAEGADSAFENGAPSNKEIFLPWKNFNQNKSPLYNIPDKAFEIARQFHPAWASLKNGVKNLHSRNVLQILGQKLDHPCDIVICYTPNGTGSGGTGQALRIAKYFNIPIIDLGKKEFFNSSILQIIEKIELAINENFKINTSNFKESEIVYQKKTSVPELPDFLK